MPSAWPSAAPYSTTWTRPMTDRMAPLREAGEL
jgi:hypothetical protein